MIAEDRSTHAGSAHSRHCTHTLTHVAQIHITYCHMRLKAATLANTATGHPTAVAGGNCLNYSNTVVVAAPFPHATLQQHKTARDTATSTSQGTTANAKRPHHDDYLKQRHGNVHSSTTAASDTLPRSQTCVSDNHLHNCAKAAVTQSMTRRRPLTPFPRSTPTQ